MRVVINLLRQHGFSQKYIFKMDCTEKKVIKCFQLFQSKNLIFHEWFIS